MDENVGRVYPVGHGGHDTGVVVTQGDSDVGGLTGVGHQEHVLERAADAASLFRGEPFLEEGGEGVAVDDRACGCILHGDVAVSVQGQLTEMVTATIPMGTLVELVQIDVLAVAVARKDVVKPERAIRKKLLEILCLQTETGGEQAEE